MIGVAVASRLLSLLLAFVGSDLTSLLQNENAAQQEPVTVRLRAELVLVPVEVVHKKTGLPVEGLKREDFVVFEDGARQEVSFFGQDEVPFRLILVLPSPFAPPSAAFDSRCKGFVASADRARQLAIGIVESLRPGDSVAVFATCGSDLTMVSPFTDDLAKVRAVLKEMRSMCSCERGIIGLHRLMLMEVMKYTSHYPGRISRPILLLIEENFVDPNRPEFPLKNLVAEILNSGTTICAIDLETPFGKYIAIAKGIFIGSGVGYLFIRNKSFGYFSDLTNGLVVKENVEKPEVTVREIASFLETMRRSYVIGFRPNSDRSEGRLVKIKVELSSQARKKNKNVQLRYRRGYIAAVGREGESK